MNNFWGISPWVRCPFGLFVSAAAAEYEDESYDDKPNGAIIEKVAKTVIHNVSSVKIF